MVRCTPSSDEVSHWAPAASGCSCRQRVRCDSLRQRWSTGFSWAEWSAWPAGRSAAAPRLEDLFSITDCWFDLLLVSFLIGVALSIGFSLCVLPGFLVFGLLMLAIPLVAEGRLPATGAIIQSWNALKSQWLTAAVFHWVLFILAGSGLFLCFFGVCLTGPLYSLSVTLLYRRFFDWGPVPAWKKQTDLFPEV